MTSPQPFRIPLRAASAVGAVPPSWPRGLFRFHAIAGYALGGGIALVVAAAVVILPFRLGAPGAPDASGLFFGLPFLGLIAWLLLRSAAKASRMLRLSSADRIALVPPYAFEIADGEVRFLAWYGGKDEAWPLAATRISAGDRPAMTSASRRNPMLAPLAPGHGAGRALILERDGAKPRVFAEQVLPATPERIVETIEAVLRGEIEPAAALASMASGEAGSSGAAGEGSELGRDDEARWALERADGTVTAWASRRLAYGQVGGPLGDLILWVGLGIGCVLAAIGALAFLAMLGGSLADPALGAEMLGGILASGLLFLFGLGGAILFRWLLNQSSPDDAMRAKPEAERWLFRVADSAIRFASRAGTAPPTWPAAETTPSLRAGRWQLLRRAPQRLRLRLERGGEVREWPAWQLDARPEGILDALARAGAAVRR